MHICVNWVIIGSNNGLSHLWSQAITGTNVEYLLTYFHSRKCILSRPECVKNKIRGSGARNPIEFRSSVCDNTDLLLYSYNGPLPSYLKLRVVHAPGMSGTYSPPPLVSDPDMHRGTCVTQVPWCMPGSLTSNFLWSRWRGNIPGIPGGCATQNFRW